MKLWIQNKPFKPVKVTVEDGADADDVLEAAQKKLLKQLGSFDSNQLSLTKSDKTVIEPNHTVSQNTYETPYLIVVLSLSGERLISDAQFRRSRKYKIVSLTSIHVFFLIQLLMV